MHNKLRIATRASPLALWQAHEVKRLLEEAHPALAVEIVSMVTRGDKILDRALNKVGGKGLFIKELEVSLLNKETDIAVHSMKDVPMDLPDGFTLGAILQRADPRDAFVSNHYPTIDALPKDAVVGTSSLRRQALLSARYPALQIKDLRGNVGTRLSKLDNGDYHAIILAAAGLQRLQLEQRIASFMSIEDSLPAIGQGAIGIECRADDDATLDLLKPLMHTETNQCLLAERQLNRRMHGGCHVPIAGHAVLANDTLHLTGFIGLPDGSQSLWSSHSAAASEAEHLGNIVAEDLLSQGAKALLERIEQYA